jgi:hypothetical protein
VVARNKAISVGLLSVLILGIALIYGPHVIQTMAYDRIIHAPLPKLTQNSFTVNGIQVRLIKASKEDTFVSENAVLKIAKQTTKSDKGTNWNINLVNLSQKFGSSYVHLGPAVTQGDPHFQQTAGNFENVPCYVITINGVPPSADMPKHSIEVLVIDATNGKKLLGYKYGKEIPVNSQYAP